MGVKGPPGDLVDTTCIGHGGQVQHPLFMTGGKAPVIADVENTSWRSFLVGATQIACVRDACSSR